MPSSKNRDLKDETQHQTVNKMLTDDELNKLLDEAVADLNTEEVDEEMFATLIPVTRKNFGDKLDKQAIVMFADMPAPGQPRIDAFKGLGGKLADEIFFKERPYNMPMALVFSVEMWYLNAEDKKDDDSFISEYENKKEGVMIHVMSLDGRTAMAMYNIDRNEDGKKICYTMKSYQPYKFGQSAHGESYLGKAFFEGAYADFKAGKK